MVGDQVVNQMIDDILLRNEAEARGLSVDKPQSKPGFRNISVRSQCRYRDAYRRAVPQAGRRSSRRRHGRRRP
jgi:hypothetical protein